MVMQLSRDMETEFEETGTHCLNPACGKLNRNMEMVPCTFYDDL